MNLDKVVRSRALSGSRFPISQHGTSVRCANALACDTGTVGRFASSRSLAKAAHYRLRRRRAALHVTKDGKGKALAALLAHDAA
jgi:hypothetical protein